MASLYGIYEYTDYAFTYERSDTRGTVPTPAPYNPGSVMWVLETRYPTMAYLARRSGLDGLLDSPQSAVTVFAAPEESWAGLGVANMDKNTAYGLISYALLPNGAFTSEVLQTSSVQYLNTHLRGQALLCDFRTDPPTIDGRALRRADMPATNGVLHEIEAPLAPYLFA